MSALMADVIEGAVAPGTCNAACNAGGKMIRIVELQLKYGIPVANGRKDLMLTMDIGGEQGPEQ
jgi:hypothetical protein